MRREQFRATLQPEVFLSSSLGPLWCSLSWSQFIVLPAQWDSLVPPSPDILRNVLFVGHHHSLVHSLGRVEAKKSCSVVPKGS